MKNTCDWETYHPHGVCVSDETLPSNDPTESEKEHFNPYPYSVPDCLDFKVDVVGAKHMLGPAVFATGDIHSK